MQPLTDLQAVFQDGYSFEYDYPYAGLQQVTISTHTIGDLILTSGKIIARDPLGVPEPHRYFTQTLEPGHYPVVLSAANFQPRQETRIACAMIRISDQPTVRWENAAINGQPPPLNPERGYGYGVDSGIGCFMDADAELARIERTKPNPLAYEAALRISRERALKLTARALHKWEAEFSNGLLSEMLKNGLGPGSGDWANFQFVKTTQANLIAFSSGMGDGGYASYWGYDAANNLTSLVTDFAIFSMSE